MQLFAVAGLVGLAAGQAGLLVMGGAVAALAVLERRDAAPGLGRMRPSLVALAVAGLLAVAGWRAMRESPPYDVALLAAARDAGLWIGANTPPGSMVFVPSGAVDGEDDPVSVWARRPVWYDWKEGAAVMWTPGYYQEWSERRGEMAGLRTEADLVAYACTKRIDILVETAAAFGAAADRLAPALAYANNAYAVLRTGPLCAARS